MPLPNGAEEEFGDQRRLQLLDELERCIGLTLPPAACAFLWLADIGNLEDLVGSATRTSLSAELVRSYLLNFETQFRPLHKWLQRGRKDSLVSSPASSRLSASPSLPSTPKLASKRKLDPLNTDMKQRSPIAKNFCQNRDTFRCIISKDREIDVAHIYPFALRGHHQYGAPVGETQSIWDNLSVFWSKERVESWRNAIFPDGKYNEACYNLLCLSPTARRYFRKGYFALKPISISEDQKCMVLKFFWLRKGPSDKTFVNIRDTPSLEGQDQGHGRSRLLDHETTSVIRSGDELRLETEEPQNHPLPRWEILEMQWFMNRVVAMSGVEAEDDYSNNDDYVDDYIDVGDDYDDVDDYDDDI